MKRPFLCIVALVALLFAGNVSAFAATSVNSDEGASTRRISPSKNASKIFEYLEDEGYNPSYTDDYDVVFKAEGKIYAIFLDSDDEQYFRVDYIFESPITCGGKNIVKFILARDKVIKNVKVARIDRLKDKDVVAECAIFCDDVEDFIPVIPRCMSACRFAVTTFLESIEEQMKEDDSDDN